MLLVEAAFEEGAGVDSRRRVALEIDQVAGVVVGGAAEEVVESDLIQRRRTGKGGDVAADAAVPGVGALDHGQRVPAHDAADAALHEQVAGEAVFLMWGDGVAVGGGEAGAVAVAIVDGKPVG